MSHSKNVGTGFEYVIRDQINAWGNLSGFFAKRIWYSGAGLQFPYDVAVRQGEPEDSPVVLEIEAKRRIRGAALGLGPKELNLVSSKHVIILAVGKYPGRKVPVHVIHTDDIAKRLEPADNGGAKTNFNVLHAKPGAKTVSIGKKWVGEQGRFPSILEGWGRTLLIEDFETFWMRWQRHRLGQNIPMKDGRVI